MSDFMRGMLRLLLLIGWGYSLYSVNAQAIIAWTVALVFSMED